MALSGTNSLLGLFAKKRNSWFKLLYGTMFRFKKVLCEKISWISRGKTLLQRWCTLSQERQIVTYHMIVLCRNLLAKVNILSPQSPSLTLSQGTCAFLLPVNRLVLAKHETVHLSLVLHFVRYEETCLLMFEKSFCTTKFAQKIRTFFIFIESTHM